MKQNYHLLKMVLFLSFLFLFTNSASSQNVWQEVVNNSIPTSSDRYIIPAKYKTYALDINNLSEILSQAPKEFTVDIIREGLIIELPMPNGEMQKFSVVESSMMHENLAQKFPAIKSYLGQGLDDRTSTLRMTIDHNGFHAMIISVSGTVYIDPYSLNNTEYCITYYKEDFYATNTKKRASQCIVDESLSDLLPRNRASGQSGDILRTYRTAMSAAGEYTAFHGGSVEDGLAAINVTISRVNSVFEREASIRLILVENNDLIIYTDAASDPYSGNTAAMLGQNQNAVDDVIGNSNYDIGHVVGTTAGGIASSGSVCNNNYKAQGVTGTNNPINDPFDIDYVAHEIGHQFGGNHPQNNDCERNEGGIHAYEPGSGSTIMGYAGICFPNLQNNSDDYYHTHSFDEITEHVNGENFITDCSEQIETGNNIPVANAGVGGFTIPISTPFELIGSGNDIDAGDELTYCWEQFDLGPVTNSSDNNLTNPSGNQPIFRSWPPTNSSTRIFPRLQDLLSGSTTIGEHMPTYTRDLTFRLTVRDNRAGSGGVSYDQMNFDVSDAAGPFLVNDISEDWEYGMTYPVTWDVANTNIAPVSCSTVDIYLSLDGGNTFEELLTGVPNNGSVDVLCPNEVTTQARLKVKGSDNIFFNISNIFQIVESSSPNFTMTISPESLNICSGEMAVFDIQIDPILDFNNPVSLSHDINVPGLIIDFNPQQVNPGDNATLTISSPIPPPAFTSSFTVTATSDDIVHSTDLELEVFDDIPTSPQLINPSDELVGVSLTPTFTWEEVVTAFDYTLQIASDSAFTTIIHTIENISEASYAFDVLLAAETPYYWSVVAQNPCGESPHSDTLTFVTGAESVTEIPGCTDPTAFNYNVLATLDDGSCEPFIFGCTNPDADNYNSEANSENGSCIISGCINPEALNYDATANNDDGSCIIGGCTDPLAFNYDEDANLDDGTCVSVVEGCMEPEAYNYNPNANQEDGSCDYESLVIIQYDQLSGNSFYFWAIINDIPSVTYLQWDMGDGTEYTAVDDPTHEFQQNGTYQVSVNVIATTGAFIAYANVEVEDVSIGCTDETAINYEPLASIDDGSCIDAVYGCTDALALNYNPDANSDDGSCIIALSGCTDETAVNYNPEANIDDGSCEEEVLGCNDSTALNFDELANTDDGSCEYPLPTEPDWDIEFTSSNHIILIPTSANILINDAPIEIGDYLGVFYQSDDGEYYCAGRMIWEGETNTMTVYGTELNEDNGMALGEEFTWMTWKASLNEVRMAIVDYDLTMPNKDLFVVDGISGITALSNTMAQDLKLLQGWNFISTYIVPNSPDISEVFSPVVDNLFLAKDEFGSVYWPEWDLNNIGEHTVGKAYKVKMNLNDTLQVRGEIADPLEYPLILNEGWSYLGYLRKQAADVSEVMASVSENILLIKDAVGNVYWPEYNVNTMGNMQPGQGYQIRMTSESEFIYPSNDIVLPELRISNRSTNYYFPATKPKEFSMNIALPQNIIRYSVEIGDEFAVKNIYDEVIGTAVYVGETIVLTLWMDAKDIGETFNLYSWSKNTNTEHKLMVDWNGEDAKLLEDAILIASSTSIETDGIESFNVYPNPMSNEAYIEFYQERDQLVNLSLYNALGELVLLINNKNLSSGYHSIKISVEDIVNGVYFIKFNSASLSSVKLLQVNR